MNLDHPLLNKTNLPRILLLLVSVFIWLPRPIYSLNKNFVKRYKHSKYVAVANFAIESDVFPYGLPENIFHAIGRILYEDNTKGVIYEEVFSPKKLFSSNNGDIVFIYSRSASTVLENLLPNLGKKVSIILSGDPTFPDGYKFNKNIDEILSHPNLLHLFVQNNNYKGTQQHKVTSIPIGLDYHSRMVIPLYHEKTLMNSPLMQEKRLKAVLDEALPTTIRNQTTLYCDFVLSGLKKRVRAFEQLKIANSVAVPEKRIPREELWKIKSRHSFDISVAGSGEDCYRTWESLLLGCIVIVKKTFLSPLYEGLPVISVDDWSEVTPTTLKKWLKEYGDVNDDIEARKRLTHKYWWDLIKKKHEQSIQDYVNSKKKHA